MLTIDRKNKNYKNIVFKEDHPKINISKQKKNSIDCFYINEIRKSHFKKYI